ncbi:hypothetical protein PS6_008567, partial [Mucor atramentarius]
MPFKLSRGRRIDVKLRILAGESTINIAAGTGVSKSTVNRMKRQQVNRMKRQVNPNYTRQSVGRRSLVPASTHNIVRLKLRSGQLRYVDHVQSYLRSIGYLAGYYTV